MTRRKRGHGDQEHVENSGPNDHRVVLETLHERQRPWEHSRPECVLCHQRMKNTDMLQA